MNIGFYSAATSAYYHQQRLNVISNNTANINTVGYKAQTPTFSELMSNTFAGVDGAQLTRGSGSRLEKADINFEQGVLMETRGTFDYAIEGEGFFALRDIQTGEISYTRAGDFQMAQYGGQYYLTDYTGQHYVLSQAGQPIMAVRDQATGVVDLNAEIVQPGVFDFTQKNGMQSVEDNRFVPVEKNGVQQAGTGIVRKGWLEGSNTDVVEEISKVIEAQRAFSYALAMVRTQDEIETTINGLRG